MEDVGFLPTATTHLRKLRILGLWSLKLLWKKVLPHAIMVVRDEILFANLIDFPSFFKYFSGFLFAFASTGGWWSLVFLAALIRHVHAVLDHTPSPLGTRSHSPKSATKRSQRVSKKSSVAVARIRSRSNIGYPFSYTNKDDTGIIWVITYQYVIYVLY